MKYSLSPPDKQCPGVLLQKLPEAVQGVRCPVDVPQATRRELSLAVFAGDRPVLLVGRPSEAGREGAVHVADMRLSS